MGGDLSDDDSIHLHTPPKGTGRCCAGCLCVHTHSRYFPSGLCSDCGGYAHDKDCIQVGYDGMWMPGKPSICKLCVFQHEQDGIKAKEWERRKAREATRKFVSLKTTEAMEIHQNTNPFNYNQMKKVLKDRNLTSFLKVDKYKKKTKYKGRKF